LVFFWVQVRERPPFSREFLGMFRVVKRVIYVAQNAKDVPIIIYKDRWVHEACA
jgi:hypothetical protein